MTVDWEQPVQLRPTTMRVDRGGGQVLFADGEGRGVRVSPVAASLYPSLRTGASPAALVAELQLRYPRAAGIEEQVLAFVAKLVAVGLIAHDAPTAPASVSSVTRVVDWIAGSIASPLRRLPPRVRAAGAVAVVLAAVVVVASAVGARPHVALVAGAWRSVLVILLVAIPMHELAHAIVARIVGVRVTNVGVTIRGLPRLHVHTPGAVSAARLHRVAIAAAGPATDLMISACAWSAVRHGGPAWLAITATWSLLGALAASSPLVDGDGARALCALLDDELVRQAALGLPARLTPRRRVRAYRWTIVGHLVICVLVVWGLFR